VQTDAVIVGTIGWASLIVFLAGTFVGSLYLERAYRPALVVFVVATVGGFTFSLIAGFSIGRFTAVLPLIVTAFAVTRDRDPRLQLVAYGAAIGVYVLLAWIIGEQVGYWGIHLMLPVSLVAYAAALIFPPRRTLRRPSS
jgi:hypothetical protein